MPERERERERGFPFQRGEESCMDAKCCTLEREKEEKFFPADLARLEATKACSQASFPKTETKWDVKKGTSLEPYAERTNSPLSVQSTHTRARRSLCATVVTFTLSHFCCHMVSALLDPPPVSAAVDAFRCQGFRARVASVFAFASLSASTSVRPIGFRLIPWLTRPAYERTNASQLHCN